jgi:hypothetical protein
MGPNYSHFAEATVSKTRGCISLHRTIEKGIDDMIGDEVYRSEKDTFVAHLLP